MHLQETCHCTWVQSDHADTSDLSRSIGNKTYYGEVTGKEKKNSTDDKERHKKPPSPTEGRWVLCIWLCSGRWCTLLPSLPWLPWHTHPRIYRKEQLNWMLSALPGVIPILQAMKNFVWPSLTLSHNFLNSKKLQDLLLGERIHVTSWITERKLRVLSWAESSTSLKREERIYFMNILFINTNILFISIYNIQK